MKSRMSRSLATAMVVLWVAGGALAADPGRVLKSVVFPGMGQLGDNQTIKGLSFMAAEVVLITVSVGQFSRASAYARETEFREIEYDTASTYEEKVRRDRFWRDAYESNDRSKKMGVMFAGLAVTCWGLNIFDAILFAPREEEGESAGKMRKLLRNTSVAVVPDGARLDCTVEF